MAITPEQIYAVADELAAEGKKTTLSNVRKVIGSGSFTTISDAMTEWRENQKEILQPIREAPPESIATRVNNLSAEIWTIAVQLANSRLNSEREALKNDRAEIEATRKEAVGLADEISDELDALKVLYEKAVTEGRQATEQLVAQQEKTLTLSKQLEAAEIKLNATQARMTDLKTELAHAHDDAKSHREQLAEAQKTISSSREAAAHSASALEELKVQHRQAIEDGKQKAALLASQQTENHDLAKQLDASMAKVETIQTRMEDLKADSDARINDLKTELAHAHNEAKSQREQLADANKLAGDSREAAARFAGELDALKLQYEQLVKQLKSQ